MVSLGTLLYLTTNTLGGTIWIEKSGSYDQYGRTDDAWCTTGQGGSFDMYINTSVSFTSGELQLYVGCRWGDGQYHDGVYSGDLGRCNNYSSYPGNERTLLGTINISSVPYNPHVKPYILLTIKDQNEAYRWSKQGSSTSIDCTWRRNGDPHQHNINIRYDNSSGTSVYNQNSDAENGSFNLPYITPSTRDYKYYMWGKITDNNDSSYNDEDTVWRGVYGLPTLSLSQSAYITAKGNNNVITANTGALSKDTDSNLDVDLTISDGGTSETGKVLNDVGTNATHSGTYTYTTKNASSWYTITGVLTHNQSGETNSVTRYGYTYTQPVVSSVLVSPNIFSPQDVTTLKWNTNSRGWSAETSNFKTYVTISGSNKDNYDDTTNNGPTNSSPSESSTTAQPSGNNSTSSDISVSLTSGTYNVQSIFDANARSVAQLNSTVTIKRKNVTGNLEASNSTTFIVQYQPTQKPTSDTVKDQNGNNIQGKTIAIQNIPIITVGWAYNHTIGAAGGVNGYKVEIYDSDNVTKQVKYYSKSALETPVSITLDTATELKRGKMNYAKVTPYYFKPNQSGTVTDDTKIILGTQSYSFELVKPYYRMEKPVIEYPINNTTWHNKDFRILTTIPEDPDFNEYTQQQKDNYTYGNIQVEITPTGGSKKIYDYTNIYSGYTTQYPNCFSSLLTDYNIKKAIWLNKNDGDVATATKYTIRVRVQKANYEYTTAEMQDNSDDSVAWSPWSDPVVLNITAVTKQNLIKGNKIMATEQNVVANYSTRLLACYPFSAKDSRNVLKARGDIIYRAEYQGIYETIKSIITGVANYCPYTNSGSIDRRDVQFGYGTKELPSFTAIQEIILANEIGVDDHGTTGRNYKNILTGYMIDKLK